MHIDKGKGFFKMFASKCTVFFVLFYTFHHFQFFQIPTCSGICLQELQLPSVLKSFVYISSREDTKIQEKQFLPKYLNTTENTILCFNGLINE